MPLVVLCKNPEVINEEIAKKIAQQLPMIVAEALDVPENPDGRLTKDDIEVWVQDASKLDVNSKDLSIIIWANNYPERMANLDERRAKVAKSVRQMKPTNATGFIWILLQPGSFEEL